MVEVRSSLLLVAAAKERRSLANVVADCEIEHNGVSFRKIAFSFPEGIVLLFVPSSFASLPFASVRRRKRTVDLHSTLVYFRSEEIS